MEKADEVKDIMWRLNLTTCNLIQHADKKIAGDLVNQIVKELTSCSYETKKYFPLLIDANRLQRFSLELEDRIVKYAIENNFFVTDQYYKIIELRKKACDISNLEELRELKAKIFELEKETVDEKSRDMKNIFLKEYFNTLIPIELFDKYPKLIKYISEQDLIKLKKKLICLSKEKIKINELLEIDSPFYDDESFYKFLKGIQADFKTSVPVFIINGELIVDYDLQENINYYMCNQRSGVFTLNFITNDTIYHRNFQNWYLEEIHDIITTNVKSKRYINNIK